MRIPGGLEILSDPQRSPPGLHRESDPLQYPARQTGQICRNRAHSPVYSRGDKEAQPSIPNPPGADTDVVCSRAEGGCPQNEKTDAKASLDPPTRSRLAAA